MNTLRILTLPFVIIALLVLAGGAYPWVTAVAGIMLCVVAIAGSRTRTDSGGPPPRYRHIELAMLAILIFLLLVLQPVPRGLARYWGNPRHPQHEAVTAVLQQAADLDLIGARPAAFALTRNRAGTMRNLQLVVAAFAAMLLSAQLSAGQRRGTLRLLCLLGGGLAVAGFVTLRVHPQGDTLWWIYPVPHRNPGPALCFVNRNHFAGFLAMLSPAALALFLADMSRRRFLRGLLMLAVFGGMGLVLLLTLSRGAVVAYAGGMTVLFVIYAVRRHWLPAALLAITGGLILAGAMTYGGTAFKSRMAALRDPLAKGNFDERLDEWRTCGAIWQHYPLLGAGPDAYRMVFPQHRTTSRREYATHAENEYLQLVADTGVVGVALFLGLLLALGWYMRGAPVAERRHMDDSLLPAAVGGAIGAAATHACFDFAPHLPVYGITLAAMAGLGLTHADGGLRWPWRRLTALGRLSWPLLAALLILLSLAGSWKQMRASDSPRHLIQAEREDLARALTWAPSSWQAWCYFGYALLDGGQEASRLGERCVTRSAELDPNNYVLWKSLGELRQSLGMIPEARAAFARVKELRYWVTVPDLPDPAPPAREVQQP